MKSLTRLIALLLRCFVRMLPAGRREWGEAVWAEADGVPAGRGRLLWLLGGMAVVAREMHLLRKLLAVVALVAGGGAAVRFGWPGPSGNPAVPIERVHLVVVVSILVALPGLTHWRWAFGPVADSWPARAVRVGGYVAVGALVPVASWLGRFAGARFGDHGTGDAASQAQWHREMVSGAVSGSIVLTGLMTSCALLVLWLTSRRAGLAPTTLLAGAGTGVGLGLIVYALSPLGAPPVSPSWLAVTCGMALLTVALAGPILAGRLAVRLAFRRRSEPGGITPTGGEPIRHAVLAGLTAGVVAALLITVLTIPTMLLFPHDVPLKWANPDPAAPHGTAFEVEMSVGDSAGKYEGVLLLAPIMGFLLGGAGVGLDGETGPAPEPEGPDDPEGDALAEAV